MVAPALSDPRSGPSGVLDHPIPDPTPPSNYYTADHHLPTALARYYAADPEGWRWADGYLREWGAVCARQVAPLYELAEANGPTLTRYDRRGERVDALSFHPAYHEIGRLAYGAGLAAMCNRPGFRGLSGRAPQLVKFAAMYQFLQAEGSVGCPVSMTDILARVLDKYASPEVVARYAPRLTSLAYEDLYTGAMFLTEKTGGSDVGATTTRARRAGDAWELDGDKWFCSNVGADLILTLARPDGAPAGTRGLGLFLVPRVLPDGRRNTYGINRLKDKLGTRAMASGEVTFERTTAYLIEPLERGFVMMMDMVNGTRLHSGVAGAAALRRAVVEATLHARERRAFGRPLAEQPLLGAQLADLIVDSDAAASLCMAAAHALDHADRPGSSREDALRARLLISLLKRYAASHGVRGAQASLEMRGGNGYIEDWPNARLLRDALVQVIWEGGVNMVAFDVLRALEREDAWPVYVDALDRELDAIAATGWAASLAARLRGRIDTLTDACARIMSLSRAAREIAAPDLSEAMAAVYAAVLLTAEAGFAQEREDGDADYAARSAERYAAHVVAPALAALERHGDEPAEGVADLIAAAVSS